MTGETEASTARTMRVTVKRTTCVITRLNNVIRPHVWWRGLCLARTMPMDYRAILANTFGVDFDWQHSRGCKSSRRVIARALTVNAVVDKYVVSRGPCGRTPRVVFGSTFCEEKLDGRGAVCTGLCTWVLPTRICITGT